MNVIELKNVSKKYMVSHEKEALIRNIMPSAFRIRRREEFWALKDINLELTKGESLGIIGHNGSGKSTLLNIMSGITGPTIGTVETKGSISSFLTLGAGFHPELTGEENIFLNGTILGMGLNEIRAKLSSIVGFSELNGFIDAPLQTYSTGMIMRLGFAIAVHVDFDILLIDEILSVGDIYFQKKCIDKIRSFREAKKTLVICSQSLDLIELLTDKTILLKKGRIQSFGPSKLVRTAYERLATEEGEIASIKRIIEEKSISEHPGRIKGVWGKRYGTKEAEIKKVRIIDRNGAEKSIFAPNEQVKIEVDVEAHTRINNPHFGIALFRDDHVYCYGPNTDFDSIKTEKMSKKQGKFSIVYPHLNLSPGTYFASVAIWDQEERSPYDYHPACYRFSIKGPSEKSLYEESYSFEAIAFSPGAKGKIEKCNIELKNKFDERIDIFKTGEPLKIFLELPSNNIKDGISVGVYREDGVLCFTMKGEILTKKHGKVKFGIPKLGLLSGAYYISLEGEKRAADFRVISDKKDHGMVFIEHYWNLEV